MAAALTEFIGLLVGAVVDLATGVAEGIVAMATSLFLKVDGTSGAVTGLSIFGGLVGMFAGIGLAVGLTTRTFIWVTSLGK